MEIKVTYRKKRPGISMRITKDGKVSVSASIGMPQKQIEDFLAEHQDWIKQATSLVAKRKQRRAAFFSRLPLESREQCQEATRRLNATILPLVERYEGLMGVKVNKITYKATTSMLGCCRPKTGHINYSAYLLLLPLWCIEHVVVHELAHLLVANHGPEFYAIMDRYYPRWREARRETRRLMMMEDFC